MSDEETIKRIDVFCREGQLIAPKMGTLNYDQAVTGFFIGWKASVLTFLRDILPTNHTYLQEFEKTIIEEDPGRSNVYAGVEILQRLKGDISKGLLEGFKTLITAEVFANFIEMSHHLFKKEFYVPAVSVITAVLEDGLRRIAANEGMTVGKGDTLGPLNDMCAKEGVYSAIERNMIDKFRIIRNYVDHGQWEDFEKVPKKDIGAMIDDIERFLATYLK